MTISKQRHLLLDTDIGSDVDDAMTLVQLIGQGMSNQMSITTVYGDTGLRARIAARYCKLAEVKIPIFAGSGTPMSGRSVWVSGLEGSLHDQLDAESYEDKSALEHILEISKNPELNVSILAIGPLTNIAAALIQDPNLPSRIDHLYIMGGRFDEGSPEHNFLSDAVAADIVFNSSFEITVVGLEATTRIKMPEGLIDRIAAAGSAGLALSRDIFQWWEFWGETWNVPHDPIAALTLIEGSLFEYSKPGQVTVSPNGPDEGHSVFHEVPAGSHKVVADFAPEVIAERIVRGIEQAASGLASTKPS
jgi:purine nucleosidase